MSSRPPSLWFAVFVAFIDALGVGIILPIMPDLLVELTGRTVAGTAIVGGFMAAVYALNQFLFGPVVGALSDQYGRRPLILACLATLTIDYILMGLAWSVWLLFLGRFLAGMAGASYSVATAYIADVSPRAKRSQNFGLIGAAFGIGFIFGPTLGGVAGAYDLRAPFWVAAALCFVGTVVGFFFLPESLADQNRRGFSWANSNPFASLLRAFNLPGLGQFLLAFFILTLAGMAYPVLWAYWGKEALGWSAQMIGVSLTAYGIGVAVVQGGLIRAIIPWMGEPNTLRFGFTCAAISAFIFGISTESLMVFAAIPIACLSHVGDAALSGVMTKQVSDSEQGELQGVMGSMVAVCSIVSPLIMTAIFFRMANPDGAIYFPGAPFILVALLTMLALIPLERALRTAREVDSRAQVG